jgi:hypothetical protein
MGDRLGRLETGQARIEEKLDSLDKRVEKLEGSQNKQIWTDTFMRQNAIYYRTLQQ